MKKHLLTLAVLVIAFASASAQDTDTKTAYKKEGKTFVQTADTFKGDTITAYTWRDKEGNEYPIILHTYVKGEKSGRTTAYVIRVSKKSGKEYKYYLPEGEQIAREILAEK